MLDLNAAATQIADLTGQVVELQRVLPERAERLRDQLERTSSVPRPEAMPESVRRWVAVPVSEPAGQAVDPPPPVDRLTVAAVDGSQIEPDLHEIVGCCLINVGWAVFNFGQGSDSAAELASRPEVELVHDSASPPPDPIPAQQPPGDQMIEEAIEPEIEETRFGHSRGVEVKRMAAEVKQLARLIENAPEDGSSAALADGPLVPYWVINLLDEPARARAVAGYRDLFELARKRRVAVAGYISRTRSSDVTNLLRYCRCAAVAAGGSLCRSCSRHFPHPSRHSYDGAGRNGASPCYSGVEGVNDRQVFASLLRDGQRSACFRSAGAGLQGLPPEHQACFFYFRTGDDLARVEAPAWLVEDAELLRTLHGTLIQQTFLGRGYPLALSEAHEQAVVRGPDRIAFYNLLRRSLSDNHLTPDWSAKLRSKRQPVG